MTKHRCILAMDQGTTSSRAMVFDEAGQVVSVAQQEFPQIYPVDGWVEHDPEAIWETSLKTAQEAFKAAETKGFRVEAIGITNQRETTLVWDRATSKPLYNAIVWQDRRTAGVCKGLAETGAEKTIHEKTGLLLDPYFSATKIAWILDNSRGARDRAENGALAFGTVDSFLIWRLTGGRTHATDATNASRTSLFNIKNQTWDPALLALFNVPESVLPDVRDSAADFGATTPEIFGRPVPILGVAGDQQAAAFGQCCFKAGDIKSTYGTGCFALLNTGAEMVLSDNRLLTTVACRLDGKVSYALEGSLFVAGAAVQWLRDGIGIVDNASETEAIAAGLNSSNGVYMVPAFTGLGAPYWNPDARASFFGITRATGRPELVRATLEAICYQTADLLDAMVADGATIAALKVDGGMVANDWLVQYLADVVQLPIERPSVMETTALGAAFLAGLQAGVYPSLESISNMWQRDSLFAPSSKAGLVTELTRWRQAVHCTEAFSKM